MSQNSQSSYQPRNTLGPLSLATLNSRHAQPSRPSFAPPRKSVAPRMSLAAPPHRMSMMSGIKSSSSNHNAATSSHSSKDPRPVGTKQYTKLCKQYLIAYLQEHDYQNTPTMKSLNSPLCVEVYQILDFLFKQIDPNFTIPKKQIRSSRKPAYNGFSRVSAVSSNPVKQEVDRSSIIQMFKLLGYPYNLTENHFKSIGAMHTWPHVLAALMWLVQLLVAREHLWNAISHDHRNNGDEAVYSVPDQGAAASFEQESFSFMRHITESYKYYMNEQEDDVEHMHKKLQSGYKLRIGKMKTQIDHMKSEIEEAKSQLKIYQQSPSQMEQLETSRKETLAILEKLNTTVDQFKVHEANTKQTLEQAQDIYTRMDLEMRHLTDLKKDLQQQIDRQGITPDDVKKLQNERAALSKEIKHLEDECSEKMNLLGNSQFSLQEIQAEFEEQVKEYNQLAAIVKLSYTLSVSSLNTNADILNHDLNDLLERHIRKEKDALLNRCKLQQAQTYTLDEEITKKSEEIQDARDENLLLQQEIKKNEDRMQQETDEMNDHIQRLKHQIDEAEQDNAQTYSKNLQEMRDQLMHARRRYQEREKQAKELAQISQQEKNEMSSLLLETMKQMTVFKKRIREIMRSVEDAAKKVHEELQ